MTPLAMRVDLWGKKYYCNHAYLISQLYFSVTLIFRFYCFPVATIGVRYYNLCGCNTDSSDQCGDLSHLSFLKI